MTTETMRLGEYTEGRAVLDRAAEIAELVIEKHAADDEQPSALDIAREAAFLALVTDTHEGLGSSPIDTTGLRSFRRTLKPRDTVQTRPEEGEA